MLESGAGSEHDPLFVHLEWRQTELERRFSDMHAHIDRRFDQLASQMSALPFVRMDLFLNEKASMSDKVTAAHRLAVMAVGLTVSVVATLLAALSRT